VSYLSFLLTWVTAENWFHKPAAWDLGQTGGNNVEFHHCFKKKYVVSMLLDKHLMFYGTWFETNLMGFCPLNTASGRTKSRSLPLGTLKEVTHAPNR
jgi:hypothetical protein